MKGRKEEGRATERKAKAKTTGSKPKPKKDTTHFESKNQRPNNIRPRNMIQPIPQNARHKFLAREEKSMECRVGLRVLLLLLLLSRRRGLLLLLLKRVPRSLWWVLHLHPIDDVLLGTGSGRGGPSSRGATRRRIPPRRGGSQKEL